MSDSTNKPNTGFWIIAVIALIWNLMGVFNYLSQAFMTDEMKALLPEAQQTYMNNVPAWATAAFAFAVFGGALASVFLLLKKQLSKTLFIVSLLGVLIQMFYAFFMGGGIDAFGPGGVIMPIVIILFSSFLVWYSNDVTKKGWIS